MKKFLGIVFAITLLFVQSIIYAQSDNYRNDNNAYSNTLIELSILKNSVAPFTNNEHVYLFQAINKSDKDIEVKIVTSNALCLNRTNVEFENKIYQIGIQGEESVIQNNIKIFANAIVKFYVKLLNATPEKQDTWNCTEVKIIGTNSEILSDTVLIESFYPNPKNFR